MISSLWGVPEISNNAKALWIFRFRMIKVTESGVSNIEDKNHPNGFKV